VKCSRLFHSQTKGYVSKLHVRSIPPPHLSSFASLRCYLLDGISKGAWLNRSSIIFAGSDKWSVDPRVSIVSSVADKHEYSLQIQKVDVTDDGQYTCSIQSERNLRPKHLNLVVKVPPKIYDISADITVNEGSNVSLICTASGKPEPSISWRHITPSGEVTASLVTLSEYLNITGITRDQSGDYECSALNDIAFPDTKTVRVTVNFAPSIHEMKSHGVGLGRTALLRCEAAAVPVPIFEWIIKGQGIDIKNLSSRSVLTVNNMTEDRYGNYTCVATNKIGSANASVPLIRKYLPPVLTCGLPEWRIDSAGLIGVGGGGGGGGRVCVVDVSRGACAFVPFIPCSLSCLRSLDCLIVFIRMAVMSHSKGRSTTNLLHTLTSLTHC
uniref:Neuronal growth regulator 1 n=1 Tax=Gadus morhua TaxID=8049 RepID=A0A8C5C9F0_GADMO